MQVNQEYRPSILERLKLKRRSILYWLRSRITKIALQIVVWCQRDSNYISHVKREVPDWFSDEGPNRWMADGTVELLAVLSSQGHSGGSIGFALEFFKRMALFEPWGPLTGEDHEWNEIGDRLYQNIRCSHIFKDGNGAYNSESRIFRDEDGLTYMSRDSRTSVEFPYDVPKSEVVDRLCN